MRVGAPGVLENNVLSACNYSQPLIIRTCWDHGNLVRIPNIWISKDSLINIT